ncbi:hypothetical protein VNI00_016939 [Paramarasmius palmivorus]|uniref:Uncharacterized protein n=1 Tax=Paramarasmius palmivorus TaxID=297713 RepID=A0AAW0BB74_9AGAR
MKVNFTAAYNGGSPLSWNFFDGPYDYKNDQPIKEKQPASTPIAGNATRKRKQPEETPTLRQYPQSADTTPSSTPQKRKSKPFPMQKDVDEVVNKRLKLEKGEGGTYCDNCGMPQYPNYPHTCSGSSTVLDLTGDSD